MRYNFLCFIRTRIPSPLNPSDLPPPGAGKTYVYRTRIPRRDAIGAASSPPPENNVGVPITRRRGAVKHNKVHVVRGHRLVAKFFRQPTFCAFCKDFLWYGAFYETVYRLFVACRGIRVCGQRPAFRDSSCTKL